MLVYSEEVEEDAEFSPEDMDNVPYQRGRNEARNGLEFDPRYWGYSAMGKMEYDYARGYASICSLTVTKSIIQSYDDFHALPVSKALVYEEDGDILRAKPRR